MLTSKLACGPMSREIVEAVFRYSHRKGTPLMLICSRNQIDKDTGYVFTTKKYMEYIDGIRAMYPKSKVSICRDHCGPGFGSESEARTIMSGTKSTILCDLECGFDLIHIDLSLAEKWRNGERVRVPHKDKIENTVELMRYAQRINSDIMFEIGTDENVGVAETDVLRIVSDIQMCQQVANPLFYVVQTGSLVRQTYNVGSFDIHNVNMMNEALRNCGVLLKEHNADYLTSDQLSLRKGIVDAVNIAPQLGVVQTSHVLSQALIYGVDTQCFFDEVVIGRKWSKWGIRHPINRWTCTLIAGHYHFSGSAYWQIIDQLSQKIDIKESIIQEITKVIEHYLSSLE